MKILCVLLACIALSSADGISRIVGGTTVDISLIPYQLAVWVNNVFTCGGVIISTSTALTTARCVDGALASAVSVRAGSSFRNTLGTVHAISNILIHPSYSKLTNDYDIAMLTVSVAFRLGTNIGVAPLPSVGETIAAGSAANVSGWGITTIGGTTLSGNLQSVKVPVVSTSVCTAALSRVNTITDRMLCAGYTTGGADACTGDTGGPLVYAGKLIGLVSWGEACGAVGSPTVYTKIVALRSWISTEAGV